MEVASTIQSYEREPRAKNSLCWMVSLCFVFYGEIFVKNKCCVRFCGQNILFLCTKCGEGSPRLVPLSFVPME